MSGLESRLFCRLDGLSAAAREQQRLLAVADLGLLETDSVPVFEEATQTAAQFLDAPICWLGILDRDSLWFRAALGLSKLGLMNALAKSRRMAREDSFDTNVVDSHQVLVVPDTTQHPAFVQNMLVQQYGIRSYLGTPLIASSGHCLGTLAVMDLEPREFSEQQVQFLELVARWSVSEFERDRAMTLPTPAVRPESFGLSHSAPLPPLPSPLSAPAPNEAPPSPLRLQLVGQLTQQLRAPLTAVLGMAGMLSREIYGPLTDKQREYLDVIQRSGQTLLSLIQEIMDLAALEDGQGGLNLTPVDVELLCQQVIHTLTPMSNQRELELRFSLEPGQRVWHLDKDKVRQMLYHLIFSVIHSANAGSVLRLHVSRKKSQLQFSLWVSHPWLGDGLPPNDGSEDLGILPVNSEGLEGDFGFEGAGAPVGTATRPTPNSKELLELLQSASTERPENLRLLLSRHLAEIQGGQLFVQSSLESGYRYIALLPISGFGDQD
ncbi:MAG: GAF domain-containing sensor histidine kinase [Synechococcales cyanobacterium RU_4_20]|nr:GAF domain-containing sensor histidine kinase [Synechococcales cyanobacterium RU_4_20]NJR69027.1 GAF domain-containing sensor histidine kinase [Synechococcales cyanobacterium CRU_2_2]